MYLSHNDQNRIMGNFPSIKLSYVKNIHKKVSSANIFLAIPKGTKYFVWFQHFKNKYICLYMEIDRRGHNIKSITVKNCCFSKKLCSGLGTILYGTLFNHNNHSFFTVEDIFVFLGSDISEKSQMYKLGVLTDLFMNYLQQSFLKNSDVIFGLPGMTSNRDTMDILLLDIPYTVYCIQHRYYKNNPYYYNEKGCIKQDIFANFLIKAETSDDIYTLYLRSKKSGNMETFNQALIPDYKTSVLMNSIFRNIKENANLDLLEESDDDEEFEDISENKYLLSDIEHIMKCVYNRKYKLWVPCEINEKGTVACFGDIRRIEKNNRY